MTLIARNQYGAEVRVDEDRPRASLLEAVGRRSASKMYVDSPDGPKHIGYVTPGPTLRGEQDWWTLYRVTPWEGSR